MTSERNSASGYLQEQRFRLPATGLQDCLERFLEAIPSQRMSSSVAFRLPDLCCPVVCCSFLAWEGLELAVWQHARGPDRVREVKNVTKEK